MINILIWHKEAHKKFGKPKEIFLRLAIWRTRERILYYLLYKSGVEQVMHNKPHGDGKL